MTTNSTNKVQKLIDTIKEFLRINEEALRKGRELNWELLGHIYIKGREIDADGNLRSQLNSFVDELPEMQNHKGWISSDKTVFDCLLVATLGYADTLAKRHYYGRACVNAQESEEPPASIEAFTKWVAEKHGIIAAGKGKPSVHDTAEQVIEKFVQKRKAIADADGVLGEVVNFSFSPTDASKNLGVALMEHLPDGKSRVVETTTRTAILSAVIKEVTHEPTDTQRHRIEKLARWDLNRAVALLNNAWRGEILKLDVERFVKAVQDLQKDKKLAEKFFDGEPEVEITDDGMELKEQNLEAATLDPARYILNAKINTLPPVDVSGVRFKATDDKQKRRQILDNITGYEDWRTNPPRR